MRKATLLAALCLLVNHACYAQFSGSSSFTTLPWSQLGTVTNNLVLTDNANGFTVSGQVLVNVPSTTTTISGILVSWTVDRPLAFPYGPASLTTTTDLSGFSAPPIGSVGNSQGLVQSIYTDYLGTTTSLSQIPMQLVAGVDSPPWISLTNTSAVFSHTATPGQSLHQTFFLDGIYFSGPGGTWVIDVPVTSFVTVVPEPSTLALGGLSLAGLLCCAYAVRRRRTPNTA
jgi:hypothetical protein